MNVWKRREVGAGAMNKESSGAIFVKIKSSELKPCSWKKLRSRSCVIFPTAPQPWNNAHCNRARRRSGVQIQRKNCFSNNLQRLFYSEL